MMKERVKIVAANWKMNLSLTEGQSLLQEIIQGLPETLSCEVVVAPPSVYIHSLFNQANGSPIEIASQNCYYEASGAYTGEVSVGMLKSVGVGYCITGHSERRQLFHETNDIIKAKVNSILAGGITPIFCCGETLDIRQGGMHNQFVKTQLEESIFHLDPLAFQQVVIAYEPIWAIGTGVTASPEQAQEMHAFIRETIRERYDNHISKAARILYGGSIKADNAATLFSQPDVDGGLVGSIIAGHRLSGDHQSSLWIIVLINNR